MKKLYKLSFFILISSLHLMASQTELFIEKLVLQAIENNPSIQSKKNLIQAANHLEDAAKWQYFPTPIVSIEEQNNGVRGTTIGLKQPLFAGGKIDAEYEKSKIQVQIANMSNEEMKQNIALSMIQAYYTFINAYGRVLIYQESIERLQNQREMILRKINQDVSPKTDLLLVDSRLAQAKTDLSIALVSKEKGLSTLSHFLARKITSKDLESILPLKSCSIEIPKFYNNKEFLEKSLLYSPTIEKYENQIKIALTEIEIKQSAFYPNISGKIEKNQINDNSNINETNIKLVMDLNIGAGLSSVSNLESARVNLLSAKNDKESAILELTEKLETEMSEYVITHNRYENYIIAVDGAEQTLKSYERLFVTGKKSWFEVLNAEREWTNTQLSLNDTQAYLSIAPLKLKIYANEFNVQKEAK